MPFDPLVWGLGFALTRLSSRFLDRFKPNELRARLQQEAQKWADQLPLHLATDYENIFGDTYEEADPKTRPARFQLQSILCDEGTIPSKAQWLAAFVEHWNARRQELGDRANSFFQQDVDAARNHLSDLAHRVHFACQGDAQLALRTITTQLEQVVAEQVEAAAARRRLELTPYYARDLGGKAQALILERPEAWEYRLFSAVLEHELHLHSSLRRDYDDGLLWGKHSVIGNVNELIEWIQGHLAEAEQFGPTVTALLNERLPVAFGPSGSPGDAEGIVEIAKRLGEVYRRAIEWALTLNRVSTNQQCVAVVRPCSTLLDNIIGQIQEFSAALARAFDEYEAEGFSTPKTLELTLVLTVPDGVVDELAQEFERLSAYYETHPFDALSKTTLSAARD